MVKYSLVGYDGSESSQRALRFALDLARCSGGRVRVVSVLQVNQGGDTVALLMTDDARQRSVEILAELKQLAPDVDERVDFELVHGNPGDTLITQVQNHPINHVVIGHTARGALAARIGAGRGAGALARAGDDRALSQLWATALPPRNRIDVIRQRRYELFHANDIAPTKSGGVTKLGNGEHAGSGFPFLAATPWQRWQACHPRAGLAFSTLTSGS